MSHSCVPFSLLSFARSLSEAGGICWPGCASIRISLPFLPHCTIIYSHFDRTHTHASASHALVHAKYCMLAFVLLDLPFHWPRTALRPPIPAPFATRYSMHDYCALVVLPIHLLPYDVLLDSRIHVHRSSLSACAQASSKTSKRSGKSYLPLSRNGPEGMRWVLIYWSEFT